jgi:putative spermidine/putrescine transport system ATP-binding protein
MSDRICLMSNGGIVQLGRPDELYFAPNSLFAANFLGEANILKARRGPAAGEAQALGTTIRFRGQGRSTAAELSLLIRPECFSLAAGGPADNRLTGKLADVTMLGPLTRLDVTGADGTALLAKLPTSRALTGLAIGQDIALHVSPDDVIAVPEGP